ncbi:MAG: PEP-CTERM sorting domain-containing protein [Planctomycetia bacterium]|nr:PEP-CTERM sorting domain-containing protein [Planctomycetia bacterium]
MKTGKKQGRIGFFLIRCSIVVCVTMGWAYGADVWWVGSPTSSDWNTASNWRDGNVPASGDNVYVTAYSGGGYTGNSITVGGTVCGFLVGFGGATATDDIVPVTILGGDLRMVARSLGVGDFNHVYMHTVSFTEGKTAELTIKGGNFVFDTYGLAIAGVNSVKNSGGVVNIEGGTWNFQGDSLLSVTAYDALKPSTAGLKATLNMSGGNITHTGTGGIEIGQGGANEAVFHLTGGKIHQSSGGSFRINSSQGVLNIGKVENGTYSGNGVWYSYTTLQGNSKGTLNLYSGIFSLAGITGTTTNLLGGTLRVGTYTGDLTNGGSNIEFSSSYDADFRTIGTMDVDGTFFQEKGTLTMDIASLTSYDTLSADLFEISGGGLSLVFAEDYLPEEETSWALFKSAESAENIFAFEEITSNLALPGTWSVGGDGNVTFTPGGENVPEPATWVLLVLGGIFLGKNIRRR